MLTYLIDTNVCSFAIMGHEKALDRLEELDSSQWCISSLVYSELHFGLTKGRLTASTKLALSLFLKLAPVVPFDTKAAVAASEVRWELEKIGKPSGAVDQLIAGHALSLNLTLITDNLRHFEDVPGLRIESWL